MKTAQEWINELGLEPHPEGGYFIQTDKGEQPVHSNETSLPLYTNIYFLLTTESASHFHRLTSDELWFYHAGSALTVHELHPDGSYHQHLVGLEVANGERLHHTVPAGTIFGSTVEEGYALVSCTVIPGFDFSDFKLFTQTELLTLYPEHKEIITKLAYETLPE
ncbi:cupin domain-containing protein [Marinilactibacillus kalidii]|uniref:cupin domain-containing protein n=1 Tax=Marinilactibacillus kalidii TaxID=2820274 RepID=UPI001ABE556C|nr:cupin domain-containing protein [Marinilactibacillus kalidii]